MIIDLNKYGLTKYESAAYLTLVQEGISTAFEISKKSSVPHGKVYPVLATLEQKGFVKKFEGTPARFIAIEPKIAIEKTLHLREIELQKLKQNSEKLIRELQIMNLRKPSEPLEKIKVIEG